MNKNSKYFFLLAAGILMLSSIACIESLLELLDVHVEVDPFAESRAKTEEIELLYALLSRTQTAEAQATKDTEPTLTPYPTLTFYPTFTVENGIVTITVVSENCLGQYLFADGQIALYVSAMGTGTIQLTRGTHLIQCCLDREMTDCGTAANITYEDDTTQVLPKNASCP